MFVVMNIWYFLDIYICHSAAGQSNFLPASPRTKSMGSPSPFLSCNYILERHILIVIHYTSSKCFVLYCFTAELMSQLITSTPKARMNSRKFGCPFTVYFAELVKLDPSTMEDRNVFSVAGRREIQGEQFHIPSS